MFIHDLYYYNIFKICKFIRVQFDSSEIPSITAINVIQRVNDTFANFGITLGDTILRVSAPSTKAH